MQMFTHGLITGLLFVLVGMIYDRTHTRQIGELSGLAQRMPFIATIMVVAGLGSLGLPSLAGFGSGVAGVLGRGEREVGGDRRRDGLVGAGAAAGDDGGDRGGRRVPGGDAGPAKD